jgi:cysteine desulfurase
MDNHATTPMDPRVLEATLPYFCEKFGNAASRNHQFGWDAEAAVEHAREQIARLINAKPKEIIFTSGATESDNLALKGVLEFYKDKGNHIITAVTEHKAILDTCKALERTGKAQVTYLPVDQHGLVDLDELRKAITDKTILISLMYANNEIGTIHPLREIGKLAKEKGILFHSDATQGVGKIPVDVEAMGIDLMSLSAHKMYGPKGCGALHVRAKGPRVRLTPMMDGGGHERGMRSGTLNVPGIVGFGKACELAGVEMETEAGRVLQLREHLREGLFSQLDELYLNGHPTHRLPRQPERELRVRGGRITPDGAERHRGLLRVGLYLSNVGTLIRAQGPRCGRRPGAHLDSFRARTVQHHGGSRLRRRARRARSAAPARHVAALRNGKRRRGPEVIPVGSRVKPVFRKLPTRYR